MPGTTPRRLLVLDTVWWLLPLCMAAMWSFLTPVDPADFWHHAALGRSVVQERAIPTTETFSFTQGGQPYFYQQWLGGLILYAALAAGGVQLVILVNTAAVLCACVLLMRWTTSRCRNLALAAALVCATIPLVANNWNVRPQTLALPVFFAFAWTLDVHRRTGQARLWLLPLLMLVWVNLHGSFALGLVMLLIALLGEVLWPPDRARSLRAGAWFVAAAACILVNPRGFGIVDYLRRLLTHSTVMSSIVEWQPVSARPVFGSILLGYALLVVVALATAKRRPAPAELLQLAAIACIAYSSLRAVMWFVWLTIPIGAEALASGRAAWARSSSTGSPAANAALILLLLGGVAASSPFVKSRLPLDDRMRPLLDLETPVQAVEVVRADPDPPRRLFHPMEYGSYLMWAAPRIPVFADPRIELYPTSLWDDYLAICSDRDALRHLEELRLDGLLLARHGQADLIRTVSTSSDWSMRYEDEYTVYFRRVP